MSYSNKTTACQEKTHTVTTKDLPLSCPMPGMRIHDAHPKVFLPIETTGQATCPYCSVTFILQDHLPQQ
jgi:uncharacterized Zn-finger protein